MALLFFSITLFVSAFLLFLVQPIVGKMILPKLGGTPQVWNTCMVFFQTALLAGYFYTHTASTYLKAKTQVIVHGLLLFIPLLLLLPFGPFGYIASWKPLEAGNPVFATLWVLTLAVGVPFFVVATSAPLLQKWFAATGHPAAKDPYFLYGASNLGSMLSLLIYPVLIEPFFGLGTSTSFNLATQSWLWAAGYILLILMVLGCGAMVFLAPPQVKLAGAGGSAGSGSDRDQPSSLSAPTVPEENATPAATTTPPGPEGQPAETGVTATAPPPAAPPKPGPSTAIKKGSKQHKKQRHQQKHREHVRSEFQPREIAKPSVAVTPAHAHAPAAIRQDEVTPGRRLRWILLAAVPTSLMLGVTTYMSEDVSAIPLFWIIPLALYLLSFIFVFMRWPVLWTGLPHTIMLWVQPFLLGAMVLLRAPGVLTVHAIVLMSVINLLGFFATALVCHGELARDRPTTRHLTEFYLWMSVGGMLGGMFNGLLAPILFPGVWEFPIAIFVATLVRPFMAVNDWLDDLFSGVSSGGGRGRGGRRHDLEATKGLRIGLDIAVAIGVAIITLITHGIFGRTHPEIAYGIPLLVAVCFLRRPMRFGLAVGTVMVAIAWFAGGGRQSILTERSYFGILNVRKGVDGYVGMDQQGREKEFVFPFHNLTHGTTDHGQNFLKPEDPAAQKDHNRNLSRLTTTYYHRACPVGMAMEKFDWFYKMGKNSRFASIEAIADNWNRYRSDARLPVSLIGQAAMPIPGALSPVVSQGQLLVDSWSEPPYATIGLGTGTMASYARPFQTLHFYEIDSRVRRYNLPEEEKANGDRLESYRISKSASPPSNYFTYLRDARRRGAAVDILMGDARLRMAQPWTPEEEKGKKASEVPWDKRGGPDRFYHLIVVDAFSSDAIPVHLLTKEAVEMYMQKLAPGGVLCVHVSNRHLNLVPVVADIAAKASVPQYDPRKWGQYLRDDNGKLVYTNLVARRGRDNAPGRDLRRREHLGHTTSEWVMVARKSIDPETLKEAANPAAELAHLDEPVDYESLREETNAKRRRNGIVADDTPYWTTPATSGTGRYVWTDDYSNLMSVFRPFMSRED